jgi:hypothetical protein
MKKIALLTMLLIISATTFGQQTNTTPTLTKQDYLLKSKRQKTAAQWLFAGGALLSSIGGLIIVLDEASNTFVDVFTFDPSTDYYSSSAGGPILLTTGLLSIAGSIPLFVASKKNKSKAMKLSFKNESTQQIHRGSFIYKSVPSLSLKISL